MNKAVIVALLLCVTTFTGCIDGEDTSSTDEILDPVSNLDEEELSQRFANLTASYEDLAADLASLVSNYEDALLHNIELQNDVQDLQVELSNANTINAAMNSTVAELEQQLQELTSELEESNGKLEEMHDDYNQLNSTYNSVKNDINNYTFLLDSAEDEYVKLQNNFTIFQSEFNSLSSDYSNLSKEFDLKMNALLTTVSLNDEIGNCPIGNPGIEVYTGFDDGSGNGTAGDGILEDEEIELSHGVGECGPKTHSFFEHEFIHDSEFTVFNGYLVIPFYASGSYDSEAGYYLFNLTTGETMRLATNSCMYYECATSHDLQFEIKQSGDLLYFKLPSLYDGDDYLSLHAWDGFTFDDYGPNPTYLGSYRLNWYLQPDYKGGLFFSAQGSTTEGYELFYSNGTSSGTGIVKDIYPGSGSSHPRIGFHDSAYHYSVINAGILYFTATDGSNGTELWRSDGTSSGTVMVKDIRSGSNSAYIDTLVVFNNKVYFKAYDGSNGHELWVSDGSSVGTKMVKDIRSGSASSNPHDFYVVSDKFVYFSALDDSTGWELWKSDGTEEGTELVKDIRPGTGGSSPGYFIFNEHDGMLYFSSNDGENGTELWKSDGTENGTNMVIDLNNGSNSGYFNDPIAISGSIYFRAYNGTTWSLWKTNGTTEGTNLAFTISLGQDVYGNTIHSQYSPDEFIINGNDVYFIIQYENEYSSIRSTSLYWFDLRYH